MKTLILYVNTWFFFWAGVLQLIKWKKKMWKNVCLNITLMATRSELFAVHNSREPLLCAMHIVLYFGLREGWGSLFGREKFGRTRVPAPRGRRPAQPPSGGSAAAAATWRAVGRPVVAMPSTRPHAAAAAIDRAGDDGDLLRTTTSTVAATTECRSTATLRRVSGGGGRHTTGHHASCWTPTPVVARYSPTARSHTMDSDDEPIDLEDLYQWLQQFEGTCIGLCAFLYTAVTGAIRKLGWKGQPPPPPDRGLMLALQVLLTKVRICILSKPAFHNLFYCAFLLYKFKKTFFLVLNCLLIN